MSNPGPAITVGSNSQVTFACQQRRLLGYALGVNANLVADTVIPIINSSAWSVDVITYTNASTSLTTAVAGVYSAPAAGGTTIVTAAALSGATASNVVVKPTIASTTVQTGDYIYFRITTAQGAAATVDVYIWGYDFSPAQ
jgi:hypothetical protein